MCDACSSRQWRLIFAGRPLPKLSCPFRSSRVPSKALVSPDIDFSPSLTPAFPPTQQAHALTPFLTSPPASCPSYPFLTLLVSGGHTLLLLATSPTAFRILATTVDEAIGNAFDKVAKLLQIPYEGKAAGAALERLCAGGSGVEGEDAEEIPMPRTMRGRLAFSYTSLHSAVERFMHAKQGELDDGTKLALARSFQKAAVGQLEEKLALGIRKCAREGIAVRSVVVSGGVASNQYLRERYVVTRERQFFV